MIIFLIADYSLAADRQTESVKTVEITLHFTDLLVARERDCSATIPVKRKVHITNNIIDSTLRLLFHGVTEEEKKKNLIDSFGFNTSNPLIKYYIGVSIHDGIAIVNFKKGAMLYLNSASCQQHSVKEPIEKTLLEFPFINEIKYAIEGEVVDGFDA